MQTLKKIGYWNDSINSYPQYPLPIENSSTLSDEEKIKICQYLTNSTHNKQVYRGLSICRICQDLNGACDIDDGIYVWPDGLIHYIFIHNVEIPREFVEYVLAK